MDEKTSKPKSEDRWDVTEEAEEGCSDVEVGEEGENGCDRLYRELLKFRKEKLRQRGSIEEESLGTPGETWRAEKISGGKREENTREHRGERKAGVGTETYQNTGIKN